MKTNESIRLRTTPGSSKNINVKIQQEFDSIDFLSLKITQDQAYLNFCSDYGVVAGRVIANNGFGVENAKVSIFIPLSSEDSEDPIISSIYPYVTPVSTDSSGIRYNLLPRQGKNKAIRVRIPNSPDGFTQSPTDYSPTSSWAPVGEIDPNDWSLVSQQQNTFGGFSIWENIVTGLNGPETPVGTFPSKEEILNSDTLLEVYDKYYKYTTKTNASGDYMIFGVPIGNRTVHMDVDFSDVGAASLTPDDFVSLGFPPALFNGNKFRVSTNLDSLPQLEAQNIAVDVIPFWGNLDQCEIGITRLDFNLIKSIAPSAVLFFQAFTNKDDGRAFNRDCGGIDGVTGQDAFGEIGKMTNIPITVGALATGNGGGDLPEKNFNGNVAYVLPMYEDRFITDETGNLIPSPNPDEGIPTSGKYRFYAYAQQGNLSQTDSKEKGYAAHTTETTFKYDLVNKKRLIYTIGQINGANTNQDDGSSAEISIDCASGYSNVYDYPATVIDGSERRFMSINKQSSRPAICYGNLYFMRVEVKNGNFCNLVVNNGGYGGGVLKYTNKLGIRGVLDVTDILPYFKAFGGTLPPTSASNGIWSSPPNTDPNGTEGVDLKTQAFPLSSTGDIDQNGQVSFPDRLNIIDDSVDKVVHAYTNYVPSSTDSGFKSQTGWYSFYFGRNTFPNGTSFDILKQTI